MLGIATLVLPEATLNLLSVGAQPSWGDRISESQSYIQAVNLEKGCMVHGGRTSDILHHP